MVARFIQVHERQPVMVDDGEHEMGVIRKTHTEWQDSNTWVNVDSITMVRQVGSHTQANGGNCEIVVKEVGAHGVTIIVTETVPEVMAKVQPRRGGYATGGVMGSTHDAEASPHLFSSPLGPAPTITPASVPSRPILRQDLPPGSDKWIRRLPVDPTKPHSFLVKEGDEVGVKGCHYCSMSAAAEIHVGAPITSGSRDLRGASMTVKLDPPHREKAPLYDVTQEEVETLGRENLRRFHPDLAVALGQESGRIHESGCAMDGDHHGPCRPADDWYPGHVPDEEHLDGFPPFTDPGIKKDGT